MRLEGAHAPSTDDGTIEGKPEIAVVAASVFPAADQKITSRR
jgi:hypothetical protein